MPTLKSKDLLIKPLVLAARHYPAWLEASKLLPEQLAALEPLLAAPLIERVLYVAYRLSTFKNLGREAGGDPWVPFPVAETFVSMKGSCKDHSLLAWAMLRHLGGEPYILVAYAKSKGPMAHTMCLERWTGICLSTPDMPDIYDRGTVGSYSILDLDPKPASKNRVTPKSAPSEDSEDSGGIFIHPEVKGGER